MKVWIGALAAAALLFGPAHATVLNFSGDVCNGVGGACSNGGRINQSYGDVAGALDVVYDNDVDDGFAAGSDDARLSFYSTSFSDLSNVAYGRANGVRSSITLLPASGIAVLLQSFQLGAWGDANHTTRDTSFQILDALTNAVLFSSGAISISTTTASTFNLNLISANGLRIIFGPDSFNVAIDNINFTAAPANQLVTPIPGAVALMIPGIAALFGASRRKKKAA